MNFEKDEDYLRETRKPARETRALPEIRRRETRRHFIRSNVLGCRHVIP
jgi:hypothetical protein